MERMANYCPKCGTRNLRSAHMCEKCGTQLGSSTAARNPDMPFAHSRALDQPEKTFLGIVPRSATGVIVGLVIMAIGVLLCIWSVALFIGSAEGVTDDPLDTAIDAVGAFVVLILGAIMAAIGGTIFTIGTIWFLYKMVSKR